MIWLRKEKNTRTMRLLDNARAVGYTGFVDSYGFFFDYPAKARDYRVYLDSRQQIRTGRGEGLYIDTSSRSISIPEKRP